MPVPVVNPTLWNVTDEIYGDHTAGRSLYASQVISLEVGFDHTYGFKTDNPFSLLSFRNYAVSRFDVTYGRLYNFFAINDSRLIGAALWSVLTNDDWTYIINYLGGASVAGGKLKEIGITHWVDPNTGASNSSKFNGVGGGRRSLDGGFGNWKAQGNFWSSSLSDQFGAYPADWKNYYSLHNNDATFNGAMDNPRQGKSVRLIRSSTTLTNGQTSTYTGNDGTVYTTVCIGTKEITSVNLRESKFRDGSVIPFVGANGVNYTDAEWGALTTPGCCVFNNALIVLTVNTYFECAYVGISYNADGGYCDLGLTSDYDEFIAEQSEIYTWATGYFDQMHGNTIFHQQCQPNSGEARSGHVYFKHTIAYQQFTTLLTILITQDAYVAPANTYMALETQWYNIVGYANQFSCQIDTDYDTYYANTDADPWIFIDSIPSGGSGTLLFSVSQNPHSYPRSSWISIVHGVDQVGYIQIDQDGYYYY